MAVNTLPPPPINDKPGSYTWLEWYRQLRAYVSTSGSVPWYIINFAGSSLTDIAVRNHADLQSMQGGTAGEHYHLTSAQHAALSAGPHNNLSGIQGGATNKYYHLTDVEHTALALSEQDVWTPVFTNLTVVNGTGGATYTGRYSRIGRTVFYTVKVVCTGTATTASTAGTTYCTLPIPVAFTDVCSIVNVTTNTSIDIGVIADTSRCYPATWTATGDTILISGKYEV